jgi:hypothetical protein
MAAPVEHLRPDRVPIRIELQDAGGVVVPRMSSENVRVAVDDG